MEFVRYLQQFRSYWLDWAMYGITQLGSEQVYIVLLVVTYLAFSAEIGRRLGIALLLSFYLNQHMKEIFNTDRPFVLDPLLERSEAILETALGPGFPSGHAQGAATFWGLAAGYAGRIWFAWLAGIIIVLVSLSRLYFGLHLPIDVIGGIGIAGFIILLTRFAEPLFKGLVKLRFWLLLLIGIVGPFALHFFLPTADSALLMGALAAFMTGPSFYQHEASGRWWQRSLLAILGVILAFAALYGSSILLAEDLKRNAIIGFFRYLFIGYTGILLAPFLGRVFRLVPRY